MQTLLYHHCCSCRRVASVHPGEGGRIPRCRASAADLIPSCLNQGATHASVLAPLDEPARLLPFGQKTQKNVTARARTCSNARPLLICNIREYTATIRKNKENILRPYEPTTLNGDGTTIRIGRASPLGLTRLS
jgi:hypothetical protein